jgi:hypothetical protein
MSIFRKNMLSAYGHEQDIGGERRSGHGSAVM